MLTDFYLLDVGVMTTEKRETMDALEIEMQKKGAPEQSAQAKRVVVERKVKGA